MMRLRFSLVVVALAACAHSGAPKPAATESHSAPSASGVAAQLDALIAPHFKANEPGVAVLVRKGDQILLRKAYGLADVELNVALQPEHIFRLGSVTKQFTSTAIMMLVEEGKLALADDIHKYVPEYSPRGGKVTIEHLLTHTGGVPNYTAQPSFRQRGRDELSH